MEELKELTATLNKYRHEYYNLNAPSVSDEVYDRLFDELVQREKELGVQMSDSPTQTVGWSAVSKLEKTSHQIPLLSMDKTKQVVDMVGFAGEQPIMLMPKLDGLTLKLTYEHGILVEAATRGDGNEGEIVTHNARGISGVPARIPYQGRLVVTGEAFIRPSDFEALKSSLMDSSGKPYKNGRNLAAGSVRLLDAAECRKRKVTFMPFNVLEGFGGETRKSDRLCRLDDLGFNPCANLTVDEKLENSRMAEIIQFLRLFAQKNDTPIDGIIITYNDIAYAKSCGRTGHHYKDGLAYKFEDDLFETVLRSIEWTPGRTGEIAPVAVFDPVEIDGCTVSRASLHNVSFIEGLELMPGNRVLVSKRNMIIPHVEENLDRGGFNMEQAIIGKCPCCGQPTRIHTNTITENGEKRVVKALFCDNPECETRRLKQFAHFASKKAMDIAGLSEATLETFIGHGWLHSCLDIYKLDAHKDEIIALDGFGQKSWDNLWASIQRSRDTTFEQYIVAVDIPMIGRTASKTLAKAFTSNIEEFHQALLDGFNFTTLPDFGEATNESIHSWFRNLKYCSSDGNLFEGLRQYVHIASPSKAPQTSTNNPFAGMTVVVTGKVEPYSRDDINALIESLGARAGSTVSKKTDYLVCGENAGSKFEKAKKLGVKILTPAEFFELAGK